MTGISLRPLRALAILAETLNFREAADRCHITQPALSKQIQQLETALGTRLVERSKRHVVLTPVGREVARRGQEILAAVEGLKDLARDARTPFGGVLRLGTLATLGPYLLPHVLPVLRLTHPGVKLYLREELPERLDDALAQGDLDVILTDASEPLSTRLEEVLLFQEPLWLIAPKGHPVAAIGEIPPGGLGGERLILFEPGETLRRHALAICRDYDAEEDPGFRATSLDALRQMVGSGVGPAILPGLYVEAEALADPQIAVIPFAAPGPGRTVSLRWRRTAPRRTEYRDLGALIAASLPDVVTSRFPGKAGQK
jgi:LysR family hydrogen peroxide-inducible transcriptional activator